MQTKRCSRCKLVKAFDDFGNNRRAKSGKTSHCRACASEKAKIYNDANREKSRASARAWAMANPEKRKANRVANAEKNREKERARNKAWRIKNPEKYKERNKRSYEKHGQAKKEKNRAWYAENLTQQRQRCKQWSSANRGKRSAALAKRRAALIQRTPKWLTREDFESINFIYEMARALEVATGVPHHVDHEYPLQGVLVSGLHCPLNLQILTAEENVKKRNLWSPEV